MGEGTGQGVEAWWRWQPAERWRLSGGVVAQRVKTGLKQGSRDASGTTGLANNDAKQQWFLRSYYDVSDAHQLDFSLRYNSGLPNPVVPGYAELDAQWTWKLEHNLDLALIGKNLLHSSHGEFGSASGRNLYERTALLKLVKRF